MVHFMLFRFGIDKSGRLLCDFHAAKVFFQPDRVSQASDGAPGEIFEVP